MSPTNTPEAHPFLTRPHRTLIGMSFPVLLSLLAEPLTGLVDTAFIARLGAEPLAALGVGTIALSSVFWIFGFLGIGTQTKVSQALGRRDQAQIARLGSLSFAMGILAGGLLAILGYIGVDPFVRFMGAADDVHLQASGYIRIRLLGAPAVLATTAAFGTLRGLQNMRVPLFVALGVNGLNIILDAVLIFGLGPIPPLGITGAAVATTVSQWIGATAAGLAIYNRLGVPDRFPLQEARSLLDVGSELFIRTGMLTLFLLLATRSATRLGPDAGAAHQAIRQFWVFGNFLLDAFAITAQSLVGYFFGSHRIETARSVACIACIWSTAAGVVVAAAMLLGHELAAVVFVPESALAAFFPAWLVAAAVQPVSALSFATDGIHWGTGDFRYLRNSVTLATACGASAILLVDASHSGNLTRIWIITAGWIVIRALCGMLRIWPGIGRSPFQSPVMDSQKSG